jgi:hypothetical protein
VLERGLGHEERSGQVDGDDPGPVLVGHLVHGPVDGDPGVIDQDVQAAVLLDDLVDDAAAVGRVADVAVVEGDVAAGVFGAHFGEEFLGRLGVLPIAGRDLGPSAARRWLMAPPMPRVPPVTRATRPASGPFGIGGDDVVAVLMVRAPVCGWCLRLARQR